MNPGPRALSGSNGEFCESGLDEWFREDGDLTNPAVEFAVDGPKESVKCLGSPLRDDLDLPFREISHVTRHGKAHRDPPSRRPKPNALNATGVENPATLLDHGASVLRDPIPSGWSWQPVLRELPPIVSDSRRLKQAWQERRTHGLTAAGGLLHQRKERARRRTRPFPEVSRKRRTRSLRARSARPRRRPRSARRLGSTRSWPGRSQGRSVPRLGHRWSSPLGRSASRS